MLFSKPWLRCSSRSQNRTRIRSNQALSSSKPSITQEPSTFRIFERIQREEETGGAGGRTSYKSLQAADKAWYNLRNNEFSGIETGSFVVDKELPLDFIDYDVLMCGGTLGIFLACCLQKQGLRVAIIERGLLKGRRQEWNISRAELDELRKAEILSIEEIESCINIEWDRVRAGFHNGFEVWTTGVLNLGVSPERLIELCRQKFIEYGGVVCQKVTLSSVEMHLNGVKLCLHSTDQENKADYRLSGRLLIDCMGHMSPIVQQIRKDQKPDGVCLVVGTLARGFHQNDYSDLIKTNTPILPAGKYSNRVQYFWEAFPAGSGSHDRTTYMFTYLDASPQRPSLEELFEDYWQLMPKYQNVDLQDIEFLRALFGFFPTYKDSPLMPAFDRIIHVGDAGGLQSPLSFGGFAAMLRHLTRHTKAITSALNANIVDKQSLSLINPYNPGLSASWLFQKAMCAQQKTPENFINETLSSNFQGMDVLGPKVLIPFLQDITRFTPLSLTLLYQIVMDPIFLVKASRFLGVSSILDWLPHFLRLGAYEIGANISPLLNKVAESLPPRDQYKIQRYADALKYGSGADSLQH